MNSNTKGVLITFCIILQMNMNACTKKGTFTVSLPENRLPWPQTNVRNSREINNDNYNNKNNKNNYDLEPAEIVEVSPIIFDNITPRTPIKTQQFKQYVPSPFEGKGFDIFTPVYEFENQKSENNNSNPTIAYEYFYASSAHEKKLETKSTTESENLEVEDESSSKSSEEWIPINNFQSPSEFTTSTTETNSKPPEVEETDSKKVQTEPTKVVKSKHVSSYNSEKYKSLINSELYQTGIDDVFSIKKPAWYKKEISSPRKRSGWLQLFSTLLPFGLLLAGFPSKATDIDSTESVSKQRSTRQHKVERNVTNPVISKLIEDFSSSNLTSSPTEEVCNKLKICETALIGSQNNGTIIDNGIWLFISRLSDEQRRKLDLQDIFEAAALDECSSMFNCTNNDSSK